MFDECFVLIASKYYLHGSLFGTCYVQYSSLTCDVPSACVFCYYVPSKQYMRGSLFLTCSRPCFACVFLLMTYQVRRSTCAAHPFMHHRETYTDVNVFFLILTRRLIFMLSCTSCYCTSTCLHLLAQSLYEVPGELFCWDFFEMFYKMTVSSAKLDQ